MYHKDRESRCLYYLGRYNSKIVMTMLLVKSRNEHPEDIAHPSHTAFFYHSRGRKSFLLSGESPFQVDRKKSQNSIVHFPISPVKTVRNSQYPRYHRKNPLISIYCFKYLPNLLSHIRQIIILQPQSKELVEGLQKLVQHFDARGLPVAGSGPRSSM